MEKEAIGSKFHAGNFQKSCSQVYDGRIRLKGGSLSGGSHAFILELGMLQAARAKCVLVGVCNTFLHGYTIISHLQSQRQ